MGITLSLDPSAHPEPVEGSEGEVEDSRHLVILNAVKNLVTAYPFSLS